MLNLDIYNNILFYIIYLENFGLKCCFPCVYCLSEKFKNEIKNKYMNINTENNI